ncbi:MAG: cation diffusion facilitator family transporter [Synergistetes bacterium]|nr:cation diffusion facilitator family transporter [Synergistota bacterium]MDW8192896.1 cation diffusion facilitator family transporter [Synergistota bacterium]
MVHEHHNHIHEPSQVEGIKLFYVILLNFAICGAEFIGGIVSGSLALISDSLHNFSDAMSIVVTYFAHKISLKSASERKTFGYKRSTILAALFNSVTLLAIGALLIKEAIERLLRPQYIDGLTVLWVASIGLVANLLSMYFLKRWSRRDINVKTAYLHMFADALSSIAVILGAIMMLYFNLWWLDPTLSIAIAIYVIRESFKILNKSLNILMQSTPETIDIGELVESIERLEEVKDVHHVHVWSLDDKMVFFEGHVNLKKDIPISKVMRVYDRIEEELHRFGISHVTIQAEYNGCPECGVIKSREERDLEHG